MKKEKIYDIKLFEDEINYIMSALMDKTISFEGKKSDEFINYEKLGQIYIKLFYHFSLILRYQGDSND